MKNLVKDQPVYVKERHYDKWIGLHFAEYGNGKDTSEGVFVYCNGKTSFTAAPFDTLHYDECRAVDDAPSEKDIIHLKQ
jgi:hypothetical protein